MMRFLFIVTVSIVSILSTQAQAPVADFTISATEGCAPFTVRFTNTSTGNPTEFYWSFGNGDFSEQRNPSITFNQPGTFDVHLVVRNSRGTSEKILTGVIKIDASPTASFNTASPISCLPSNIQFNDLSQPHPNGGAITRWEWDFGNGVTSNERNPVVSYSEAGFYTTSLRVYSENNCAASRTVNNYIRILNGVTPNFIHSDPLSCTPPLNVQFTDQTSAPGNLTYLWDFGDGTTSNEKNPTHGFSRGGTHNVSLTVNSDYGCSQVLQKTITINATSTDFTVPDNICVGKPVTFINQPGGVLTNTLWDFGNGASSVETNGTVTFSQPGQYEITLNNSYENCLGSITKTITVSPLPDFDFSVNNLNSCSAPFTTEFQTTGTGASYLWDFGDGNTSASANPTHTYQSTGTYTVSLTIFNENGCETIVTKQNYIKIQPPVINIENLPQGGCADLTVRPNAVVNSLDAVTQITWSTSNGGSAQGANPTFTFNTVGRYTLTATARTEQGCEVSTTREVLVGTPPTGSIKALPDTICASTTLQIEGEITDPPGGEHGFSWVINGVTHTRNPLNINLTDTGAVTIELTPMHNFCPATTPSVTSVFVKTPFAKFNSTFDCVRNGFVFTNTSLVRNTDDATYLWEFGPNANISTSTDKNPPLITFNQPGDYQVKLTVSIDANSCSHSETQTVTMVYDKANIEMTTPFLCLNQPTNFTATGRADHFSRYEWAFNSSSYTEGDRTYTRTFTTANPSVQLRVTDVNGCRSEASLDNITSYQPLSNFTADVLSGCQGLDVSFTNNSSSANSNIISYLWNFGDGTTSTNANPTHIYRNSGNYNVRLTVSDDKLCQNTFQLPNVVAISGLQSAFSPASAITCPDAPLQFTSETVGNNVNYAWNFGDQQTSNEANPVHSFSEAQSSYQVRLTVSDETGCESTSQRTITIQKPTVDISAIQKHSICPPLETFFQQNAANYRSLLWDFGDGQQSTVENPNHFYNSYNTYKAKLTAEGYGCSTSDSVEINLVDITDTRLNYDPLQGCGDMVVNFNGTVTSGTTYAWNVGGTRYENILSFEHQFRNPGNYVPSIALTDSIGCTRTVNGRERIQVLGSRVLFDMNRDLLCDNGEVLFSDFSLVSSLDRLNRHVWDFGDGNTYEGKSATHTYTNPGTYVVTKYVYTDRCENIERDTVRVFRTPTPVIESADFVCLNNNIRFDGNLAIADTAISWTWAVNNNLTSNEQSTLQNFNQPGRVSVRLTASTENECTGETQKEIEVIALPEITFQPNPLTLLLGSEANLPVVYDKQNLTYNWTPNFGLSCNDCAVPITSTKADITYHVTATDEFGCRSSEDIAVKVVCNDLNFFIPNTFSPNGDGKNDVFFPRGRAMTMVKSFRIFNRWGQVVFQKMNIPVNDASAGWDGTFNGKPASPDVYIYTIELVCENGATIPYTGNVTLLR
ncbi:PKD domain-containing protein [Gynurincola endophyticus]|uniref:PKD domain-containing protein n=1 Tax=Gynurincola endophyticus TaxID=2479004 RepID=UPI000F8D3D19|nr:PKD domain-containing protein [Gynurincola endophyticus]